MTIRAASLHVSRRSVFFCQKGPKVVHERSQARVEKVGRNLSLVALVVLLIILPFERRFGALYQGAEVAVLAGVLVRLFGQARWRFWAAAVGISVLSVGLLVVLAILYTRATQSPFTPTEIAWALLTQVGILYFCLTAVFLGQFFFRPETWAPHDRWTKTILALVWAFGVVVLISAVCSMDPLRSLLYVRKFLAPYLLVYMIVVETLYSWRHYRIIITAIYLVGIVVTSASVAARYLYIHGGYDLRSDFQKSEIVREETIADGRVELRNQWPFYHHNRLCSYALLVTFFVWLQFFATRNWELKALVAISAIMPVWCMLVTLTRGGWIALAVGALALVLMINWRSIGILLAIAFAAWFVSPTVVRDRLTSVFRPSTYTRPQGTVHLRLHLWTWSLDIIRQHPVLGLGAGWSVFEEYVKSHYSLVEPDMETSNAHNNFLEIAAESGIPAAALFLAFMGALVVQISRAWRVTRRQTKRRFVVAGFFALLIGTTVYGMSSFSLRYRIGMLLWICFALMTVLPAIARAIPEELAGQTADLPHASTGCPPVSPSTGNVT